MRGDEERLRQIIDLVPHRIFIKDWNGVYLLANKAVADAHGVSVDELEGKTHLQVHSDDPDVEKFLRDDREVIDRGEPKLIPEEAYVDHNGNSQILRTIKVPFSTTSGGRTAVLGVSVDITELKTAEDQLRHVQKLEAIGQLTGGLAHDFNNLLTIMLGNLQLLLRRLDDDKLKEMVFTAERAGRRGAELTQRLLAFGRRQSLEPRVVDLNRLVLGMTELLRRTLGETIEIETVVADAIKQTLVDPAQVENAILNLAINARDAMPQGGVLTIRTGTRKIGRQIAIGRDDVLPGEYVMLAISDTGTGMPSDVAARAFDPFFTTKAVGRGSGLGLSMIYGFCQQSGGFATIDSEPDQGTTVSLFLPATDGAEKIDDTASAPSTEAMDETGHETVLVVEDDPGVRLFAATVLSNLNYNVIEAADGPAALETLESNGKIDVLFTDVVLPGGVDGRDIANQARTRQPEINVLFTSGFAVDETDHENRELMEISMLRKPYTGAELAAKIRSVIENLDGRIQ
jgi:PAS domain S-box-containing protein